MTWGGPDPTIRVRLTAAPLDRTVAGRALDHRCRRRHGRSLDRRRGHDRVHGRPAAAEHGRLLRGPRRSAGHAQHGHPAAGDDRRRRARDRPDGRERVRPGHRGRRRALPRGARHRHRDRARPRPDRAGRGDLRPRRRRSDASARTGRGLRGMSRGIGERPGGARRSGNRGDRREAVGSGAWRGRRPRHVVGRRRGADRRRHLRRERGRRGDRRGRRRPRRSDARGGGAPRGPPRAARARSDGWRAWPTTPST